MAAQSEIPFADLLGSDIPPHPILVVYGNDQSKVDAVASVISSKISKQNQAPVSFDRIDAAEIAKDPSRLYDLFASAGLFGDPEYLLIENAAEKHSKLFKPFFSEVDARNSEARLIIASHDFKKKSAVLTQARETQGVLIVSAYDTALNRHALLTLTKQRGIQDLTSEICEQIIRFSSENGPAMVERLLDKLALAADKSGVIEHETFLLCLPETIEADADDLAVHLFAGSAKPLLAALHAARANGDADSRFVALLARLCMDVKRVQQGHSDARPRPLFWKTEKVVKAAEGRLDRFSQRLEAALKEIQQAEAAMRSSDPLANIVAERLCLRLARCFASSRRS